MAGHGAGGVADTQARSGHAAAEIHIFEPEREEALVQAAQAVPHVPPQHEERARGLLHIGGLAVIEVEATVAAVHRVTPPEPIHSQNFERQRQRRGKAAHHEAGLGRPGLVDQPAASRSDAGRRAGRHKVVERAAQYGIRVEQQNQRRRERPNRLVDPARKARVEAVLDEPGRGTLAHLGARPVGRAIIYHDHFRSGSQRRIETGPDVALRVEGDDGDADRVHGATTQSSPISLPRVVD